MNPYRMMMVFSLIAVTALGYLFTQYAYPKITLFDAERVSDNFRHLDRVFPVRTIASSSMPMTLTQAPQSVSVRYHYQGRDSSLDEFLQRSRTTGFLVLHKDHIIDERYFYGYSANDKATSFSVVKSFVATLVGIALEEGLIRSVDDPITDYVPSLLGSGFAGASIADVLQMSSGIAFSEIYGDHSSDAYRIFDDMYLWLGSISGITASYPRATAPGQVFHYASINTQALGMLVREVSGQPISTYLQDKLWQPMGATSEASWMTDIYGEEVTFMGLNATLRDFARLGLLYLHEGRLNNQRIVSAEWVRRATTPDKPWLQPGEIDGDWGYQYQWWIPRDGHGDYSAIGIWGQFIYVNPEAELVIVKTSADADFKPHEFEAITVYREIASMLLERSKAGG